MNDNLCPFLSITLNNLCKRLYHGYDTHASGRGCSKHHLRTLNLWYNSNLIPIKKHSFPFSSILICDHQNSPVELPQNQKDNKILVVFFFRHNKKYRCLLLTKHFSIKGTSTNSIYSSSETKKSSIWIIPWKNRLHGLLCDI